MPTLLLVLHASCALSVSNDPYYGDAWDPPELTGLDRVSEVGNLGGSELVVQGSGFGDDAGEIVVQFGDRNAEVLGLGADGVSVRVPPGPPSGGSVAIRVATPTGYATSPVDYVYDLGSIYDGETAWIQVDNYWESCLGGLSTRVDELSGRPFCAELASVGPTGTDGRAEGMEVAWRRVHAAYIGTGGAVDSGPAEWILERPAPDATPVDLAPFRREIGPVTLRNPAWEGAEPYCADLDGLAVYRYGGSPDASAVHVQVASVPAGGERAVCEAGESPYELARLDLCDGAEEEVLAVDWPVRRNFFSAGPDSGDTPVTVELDAPTLGIEGLALALPESVVVAGDEGFAPLAEGEDAAGQLWALATLEGCYADDEAEGERLDDVALGIAWTPSEQEPVRVEGVTSARTWVRLTITAVSTSWLGPGRSPVRAVFVTEDRHDVRDGRSHIEVPAGVLYQIPSLRLPESDGTLLDAGLASWGFVEIELQRVTEYRLKGGVVFSYATGDFALFEWTNPTEATSCTDCLDDDGDGWTDAEDPDCAEGGVETGFGTRACNDGLDDDGDGAVDRDDPLCAAADDDDESNCDDLEDNDLDGLRDDRDPDCDGSGTVNEHSRLPCENALDDDYDGWIDRDDPDCIAGGERELGYSSYECNDRADNDGDRLQDAGDPDCDDARGLEAG